MHKVILILLFAVTICSLNFTWNQQEPNEITLERINPSVSFDGVVLKKKHMKGVQSIDTLFIIEHAVSVKNFELKAETPIDKAYKGLVRNKSGQYINYVRNGNKNLRFYDSTFKVHMYPGRYAILTHLSNSYHISVKEANTYILECLDISKGGKEFIDTKAPHMFYSQPTQKTYGHTKPTDDLLLDFYLTNVELSPDGYNVCATINGKDFLIDEWSAYRIENIASDTVNIRLELLDSLGDFVDSPFNPTQRTLIR